MKNYISNNIIAVDCVSCYNAPYQYQEESIYNITLREVYTAEYDRLFNEILKLVKGNISDARKVLALGSDLIASKLVIKNNEIGNKCLISLAHRDIKKLNMNI